MQDYGNEPLTQSQAITSPVEKPQQNIVNEPKGEIQAYEQKPIEAKNIDEFRELHKTSFLAESFSLGDSYGITSVQSETDYVENFIRQEIKERGLENNFDSVNELLVELEMSLGLSPSETGISKVMKMARWIRHIVLPQRKLEERKRNFIHG